MAIFKRASVQKWIGIGVLLLTVAAVTVFVLIRPFDRVLSADAPSQALLDASNGLDEVLIDAVFLPDENALTATQSILVTNRTDTPLETLVFRTYANAFLTEDTSPAAIEEMYDKCYYDGFSKGGISVDSVTVDDIAVTPSFQDTQKTVLLVRLNGPIEAGKSVQVTMTYRVTIPKCRYRFGVADDIYQLGNVFPQLAVYEDGAFRQDEYYPIGDPFVSDCANYKVSMTVPAGYTVAATGSVTKADQVFYAEAYAVRDFTAVISNQYRVFMEKKDGVVIAAYAKTIAHAQKALSYAAKALETFNKLFGPYPYPVLTLAQVDFPFGGMEYPMLVMVGSDVYDGDSLEWTVVHETAHQWFYAVVGSDQFNDPWQDEALCEYAVFNYVGARYGEATREDVIFRKAETSMRVTVPRGITPGSPLDRYGDFAEYSLVAYNRGSALLVALETALGRDKMDAFMREYYRLYSFKRADQADFENTLKAVTGQDLSALIMDYLDTHISN